MKVLFVFGFYLSLVVFTHVLNGKSVSEIPEGSWSGHGFSEAQKQSIDEAFQRGIDESFIPGGNLMLIHRGEIILKEGFGVADLRNKRPFSVDVPCRVASLTKPHTATMIAMLVDQGKISFDDPVSKFIPGFKTMNVEGQDASVSSPTISQCLSHTTGFPSNNDLKAGKFNLNFNGDLESLTHELATKKLWHKPGTNYAYSRLGYMTVGRIAEIVTDMSYPEAMKTLLFDNIGAYESTYDRDAMMDKIPVPYQRTKNGLKVLTGTGIGTVINPGGNLITNLDGVGRLFLLHRNRGMVDGKQVVSEKALKRMYVSQPSSKGTGYGFGFNILQKRADGSTKRIQHTGASGTIAILDFDLDLIVIVLTQVPQAQTNKWRGPLLKTIFSVFEE